MTGRRRAVVVLAACAVLPLAAHAQSPRPRRIALLVPDDGIVVEPAFQAAMQELGYVAGRTAVFERRSAQGRFESMPALAAELAAANPDVLVAFLTQAAVSAKQASTTVPVVMVGVGNPVESGLVASLARPGGNVTGTAAPASAVIGKQLELIRELRPRAQRVAALWNPGNRVYQSQSLAESRTSARRLGLALELFEARRIDDFEPAFRRIAASRPDALLILGEPLFAAHASRLAPLVAALRVPAVGGSRAYVDAGVVAVYTPDLREAARRAAHVADRVLRGASPADIPVETVAVYERVVNLRVAAALGLDVPASVLAQATEVIR